MTCSGFRARHLDFVDGTLDAATRAACEQHRERCATCARLDAQVRRSLLVCHNVRLASPSCDLTARVMSAVRSDRRRRERQAATRLAVVGWAGLAAAGLLVALGLVEWRGNTPAATAAMATAAPRVAPAPVPRPTVAVVPVARPPEPLPVLGPIDAPPPVLGDTFPAAPAWPRRPAVTRAADIGFVSVSLLAP